MFRMDKSSLFSVMNNNKTQSEKQQQKAMALEFKNFHFYILFVYFVSFLYNMKNCFLPAGTLHFWRLGE